MERLYVPVVEDNALSLTEDITYLMVAKSCIEKLSPLIISKDDKYKVMRLLNEFEKECRSILRHEYLYAEHKAKPISKSLRDRLKLELNKEGVMYDELREDKRDRQDSTSVSASATSNESGEGWEESSLPF